MASLTFSSVNYADVDRTSVRIIAKLTMIDDGETYEEWRAISDLFPEGATIDYTYDTDYYSDETIYTIDMTIKGLSPGTTYSKVGIECWYTVETLDTWYEYWFEADGTEHWFTSRSNAASKYNELADEGADMWPTKEDYDNDEDGVIRYNGAYLVREEQEEWSDAENEYIDRTIPVYTRPSAFYFKGSNTLASGDKYPVNNIQELLKNIYNFDNVAMAWKRWRNQGSASTCNAFYEGNLSADMMNTAHNYLGTGKSYNSGDKISAEMFTTLENKLNN